MSYYPILRAPDCKGFTTVYNFSPNDWEPTKKKERFVNITWSSGEKWVTKYFGMLSYNESLTISVDDIDNFVPHDSLPIISLTDTRLPEISEFLPMLDIQKTRTPAWRATLGLSSFSAQTCYQGEIDPFPRQGTLLTFGPLIQYGNGIENFLIFLNIEEQPNFRYGEIKIFDALGIRKGHFQVRNNTANIISLDGLNLNPTDLPVIICKDMAGIPLYFSRVDNGSFLSLEHTHPPASLVVLGRRWEAQKILKKIWFMKVEP